MIVSSEPDIPKINILINVLIKDYALRGNRADIPKKVSCNTGI